ncbi:MAG: ATP-dependent zinc metalloprotease FtsH [bacterium]
MANTPKPKKNMRNLFRNFVIFSFIFLIVAGILSMLTNPLSNSQEISLSEALTKIKEGSIESIEVDGNKLNLTLTDGTLLTSKKELEDSLSTLIKNFGIEPEALEQINIQIKENTTSVWLTPLLTFLVPFIFIALFIWFTFRQVQGQNTRALSFGKSAPREAENKNPRKKVTFKDVAGAKESKEELYEVVDFLKNPKKYISLGARIPRGILLVGAPGTGKTLMARAVAGEANVPFFNISGSEFVEMFVGVGASRVRDLFKKAKKESPCIIFIDEIDAVGRQRGAGIGGSHDEREQTLNQILVEMDGFDTDTNVIVIAATNRPDILDPALHRPGRFDRQVVIDLPDLNDREAILKVHSHKKPLAGTVKLRTVAERTPGFSGADLANLLNEAAILAARKSQDKVEMIDCLEAIEKVMLGPERKSRVITDQEKKITAFHEAGHALVGHKLPHVDPVRKISIISRGMAAGYTLKLPSEDKRFRSRSEFKEDLAMLLGGRVAEQVVFNEITTGASNDLKEATKLARNLVTQYGMSALGPRTFGQKEEMIFIGKEIHERRDYSEKMAQKIDDEVNLLISEAQKKATEILTDSREKLEQLATYLIEKETIEQKEFEELMKQDPAPAS